jgi:sulfur-oxidizing protein SoxX
MHRPAHLPAAAMLMLALAGAQAVPASAVAVTDARMMAGVSSGAALAPYTVVGDGIPAPLTATVGDAARGRAIAANRQIGLCLLCHTAPIPEERFQGDLAPSLAGAGDRWSIAQLRLRMVDPSRLNPATIMPAYYKVDGLQRVAPVQQGKTILDAQQIEDVISWLQTLRTEGAAK